MFAKPTLFQVSKGIRKMRRDNYVVERRDRNVFLVSDLVIFFSNISFVIFFKRRNNSIQD